MLDVGILFSFVVFMVGIILIVVGVFIGCTEPKGLSREISNKLRYRVVKFLGFGIAISLLGFVILKYLCPLLRG